MSETAPAGDAPPATEVSSEPAAETSAAPAPSPADLAAEAEQLGWRRARLEDVAAGLRAASETFAAEMAAVHTRHNATAVPLGRERTELLAAIRRGEEAAAELGRRRARAAELRALLEAAEAELPSE